MGIWPGPIRTGCWVRSTAGLNGCWNSRPHRDSIPNTDTLCASMNALIRGTKTAGSILVRIKPLYDERRHVLLNSQDCVRQAARQKVFQKGALHMLLASVWPIYFAHRHTFTQTEITLTWRHRTPGTERKTECSKITLPKRDPDITRHKMFRVFPLNSVSGCTYTNYLL